MYTPEPYTSLWVYLDVSHRDRIRQVREIFYNAVGNDAYTTEDNPHITFHRGFQILDSELSYFLNDALGDELIDIPVTVTGIKLWPSIDEPHVVMLDVDVDLEPVKSRFNAEIEDRGGKSFHDPVPPHLTLFQTGLQHEIGEYPVFTDQERDRLFALKNAFKFPWELTVTAVTVGRYDKPTPN